jgi:mannose-1-phosphate guanylyltransferase
MLPVILCGGSGSRLWPLSRTQYPKQFISLADSFSLLQNTVSRFRAADSIYVICNQDHRFLVAEQLRDNEAHVEILLEPCGRNTAPAIALAALSAVKNGKPDDVLLVFPSDHHIDDVSLFQEKVAEAEVLARQGSIVAFGVVPRSAETGYGYIKVKDAPANACDKSAFEIEQFVEKPSLTVAEEYVSSGQYLWNSGIYACRADRYLELLKEFSPDIYSSCLAALEEASSDMDFIRIAEEPFAECPDISIDYAIMEPLCNQSDSSAVVIPLDLEWSDLGSWSALWDLKEKDQNANVVEGDVLLSNTRNSMVLSHDRLVAAVGVDGLVIVDTPDALLVADKEQVQNVKDIVDQLKSANRDEYIKHREVYRPWGKYDLIGQGEGFQVKQITVNAGAKLSLQKHEHRAEHWVVVKGEATIQRGDQQYVISKNESTYIPLGEIHSLSNLQDEELVMIEVQSGDYLGEDDIVRFEDLYGRI